MDRVLDKHGEPGSDPLDYLLPTGGVFWMIVAAWNWSVYERPALAIGLLLGILVCDTIHEVLDRYYPTRFLRRLRRRYF